MGKYLLGGIALLLAGCINSTVSLSCSADILRNATTCGNAE